MAAAIAFAERVSLWREELQRIVVDARLLRPEARRAVGSVLRSLLLEVRGDPEEINALRTAIEVFDTPPATPAKRPVGGKIRVPPANCRFLGVRSNIGNRRELPRSGRPRERQRVARSTVTPDEPGGPHLIDVRDAIEPGDPDNVVALAGASTE